MTWRELLTLPATRLALLYVVLSLWGVACQRQAERPARIVPQIAPVEPRRIEFAPNGQRLLVQESTGLVGVWDLSVVQRPELLASMAASAVDARFAIDSHTIITAGWDGRVRRWNDEGRLVWTSSERHEGRVRCLAIASDLIVSGGEEGAIRFWRLDGSAVAAAVAAHENAVMSIALAANGDFVSTGADESIRLWRRMRAEPLTFVASVLYQDPKRQFQTALPNMLRFDPLWGWDRAVAVSPRGDVIAGAVLDGVVRLWNADGSTRSAPVVGHGGRHVRSLGFSPRGDLLATAGWDGRVQLWNLDGSPHGAGFIAHDGPSFAIAFSAQGDYLATSGKDERVRLWNLDGSPRSELPAGHAESVRRVAFSAQEPIIAAAYRKNHSGAVRVWDLDGTARAHHGPQHDFAIETLAFSPRGDLFVTGDRSGVVQLWKTDGTAYANPLSLHHREVTAVAISPDSDLVASGARHEPLLVSDLTGRARGFVTGIGDTMDVIVFSPKGDLIAAGGVPGFMQIWDLSGEIRVPPFKAHTESFFAIAFPPAGDYFATVGGGSYAVKLWNLDGTPRGMPLEGHAATVRDLAFAPTGELLASGGEEGVVRLWNIPAGTVETLEIGLRINQLGFWRNLLWVRANGESVFFFNPALQLVATTHLRLDGLLTFTPDGWFTGTGDATRVVRAFRDGGEALTTGETAHYRSGSKVLAALTAGPK